MRCIRAPKPVIGGTSPRNPSRVLQGNEKMKYGEYPTTLLIMEAKDRMAKTGDSD